MEEKQKLLIQLVMELGKFFMTCDGDVDNREVKFIQDYTIQLVKQGVVTEEQLQVIKTTIAENLTIDYLIAQTNNLLTYATEEERESLLSELSSFIQHVIMADEVIHPKEDEYYKKWKNAITL
uniref:TerB family tellurite resistance protein n=1 Tax=Prevotella sp. GTC17253 TaxID=3236793 RepID=A0AB33IQG8_9BACT